MTEPPVPVMGQRLTERDENRRICWAVKKHVQEATPVDSLSDFYREVSATIRRDYNLDISANQVSKRYNGLRGDYGVNERTHVQKMLQAQTDAAAAVEAAEAERARRNGEKYGEYPPTPSWEDILKK